MCNLIFKPWDDAISSEDVKDSLFFCLESISNLQISALRCYPLGDVVVEKSTTGYPHIGGTINAQRGIDSFIRLYAAPSKLEFILTQYSHEFCHLLTRHWVPSLGGLSNWFDESVCDLASLFFMKQFCDQHNLPPDVSAYVPIIQGQINALEFMDAPVSDFHSWFTQNERNLVRDFMPDMDPGDTYQPPRRRCMQVAKALFPLTQMCLFWATIGKMNINRATHSNEFHVFLAGWRDSLHPDEQDVVNKIQELFYGAQP